jgi:hypothetical protein
VVIRVLPQDVPKAAARLVKLRDGYDSLFAELVAALPLLPSGKPDLLALRALARPGA